MTATASTAPPFASGSVRTARANRNAAEERRRLIYVGAGGQAVSGRDRLYLTSQVPTLLVWGAEDPMIPVSHAMAAHEAMPGSRLVVFDGVGHFPHCEDPERFVQVLEDFIGSTEPACVSQSDWRALLRARGAAASVAMTDMPSPAALEILADSKRAVGRA